MTTSKLAALATVTLLLTACGEGSNQGASAAGGGGEGGGGGGSGSAVRVTPVEVEIAERGNVSRTSTLASTIEAARVVTVTAQIAGPINQLLAREGARVTNGTVIARISVPELAAQLRSAEAALAFARSTAARSEELFAARIITAAEVERDRAALTAAEATLDALKTRESFASIRAPMNGVVTERFVESGDIVSPNQRLFTLADVSNLVTRVQVSEREVAWLRNGTQVEVSADAFPGEKFQGRVVRIFPAADSTTRMIPVEVELGGSTSAKLRPGFTARVTFTLAVNSDAVLIPVRSVSGAAGNQAVMIISEGLPVRRAVRLGAEVSGKVEVLSGVQVGDTVIVNGAVGLREGTPIRIVDPLSPDRNAEATVSASASASQDSAARRP